MSVEVEIPYSVSFIRRNPGMFIGDCDEFGIRYLFADVVFAGVDEFRLGHGTQVSVTLFGDGTIQVEDDGRAPCAREDGAIDEIRLRESAIIRTGECYPDRSYTETKFCPSRLSLFPAVIALSRTCRIESSSITQVWRGEFGRGLLEKCSLASRVGSIGGTSSSVRFQPDPELFGERRLSADTIHNLLEQLAYLNSGLRIRFQKEDGSITDYHQTSGICGFLASTTALFQPLHHPIYFKLSGEMYHFEGAIQYCANGEPGPLRGFTNSVEQRYGGSHIIGLRTGITRAWRRLQETHHCFKMDEPIPGLFLRGDVCGIVSVWHDEPQFHGAIRDSLHCKDTERLVARVVEDTVFLWFDHHAVARKAVAEYIEQNFEAARLARELRKKMK